MARRPRPSKHRVITAGRLAGALATELLARPGGPILIAENPRGLTLAINTIPFYY